MQAGMNYICVVKTGSMDWCCLTYIYYLEIKDISNMVGVYESEIQSPGPKEKLCKMFQIHLLFI